MESTAIAVIEPEMMPVQLPEDQRPAHVFVMAHAEGSGRTIRGALDIMARLMTGAEWVEQDGETVLVGGICDHQTFPWWMLRQQHTKRLRQLLAEHFAPDVATSYLSHLKGTLEQAWDSGLIPTEDYHRAIKIASVKGERLPKGRSVTPAELRALFEVCQQDETNVGRRDAAVFTLLYGAGLRRSETVKLDLDDYDSEAGTVKVRAGKGNQDRLVPLIGDCDVYLDAWLEVRGSQPGPLLHPLRKGGAIVEKRMSAQVVFDMLTRRAKEAGLKNVSPHDFRRTWIGDLLEAGADISTVQKMAGHASSDTTARYDRRGETAKRRAAQLIRVPTPARKKASHASKEGVGA